MLSNLVAEAALYGLEVHESKTKVLWNGQGPSTDSTSCNIRGKSFEILQTADASMYLGRLFSFQRMHDRELKNRINKAWAKFAVFRSELTDSTLSLRSDCGCSQQ